MSDAPRACPPELVLERHLAGELPEGSVDATHVASCAACADRLRAMQAEGDAYSKSPEARALAETLAGLDRRAARRTRAMRWAGAVLPLAAAAAWVLFARTPPPETDLTAKGSSTVALVVGRAGSVVPWNGGPLAQGDRLQLSWTSAEDAYVAVIGHEDGGATVRWYPRDEPRGALLPHGTQAFGDSLHFSPPFSGTVFAFVDRKPFPTAPLEAAIRDGLPPAFAGKTITLFVPRGP